MEIIINKLVQKEGKEIIEVAMNGRLDTIASQECADQWAHVMSLADQFIVLDMTNLEYMASSGLRMILTLRREIQCKGGTLQLKSVNADVMQILKMTACKDLFEYAD